MYRKMLKICSIMVVIVMMISMTSIVFGATGDKEEDKFTLGQMEPNGIDGSKTVTGTDKIQNVGQDIVGIIRAVGIVLSVAIISVLGIKYMMGSAEEKAGYKKSMLPYLIGAVLLFAASSLAEVIYQFATGIG